MKPTNFMFRRPSRAKGLSDLVFRMVVALVLLTSFCFSSESSATGEISGRVSNQALGLFLEGARVELIGANRTVLTDRDGHFRLAEVRAGATTLVVSYTGLSSQNVGVVGCPLFQQAPLE